MTVLLRLSPNKSAYRYFSTLAALLVLASSPVLLSIAAKAQTSPEKRLEELFGGDRHRRSDPGLPRPPRNFSEPKERLDLTPDGQLKSAPDITTRKKSQSEKQQNAERLRRQRRALLRRHPGQHVPEDAYERDQLLRVLYGHLAKAKSKTAGKRIKAAIERVWATPSSDTVALMMRRALLASKAKKYDEALKFFTYVIELSPDYAEGWNQRAYVYFKQKKMTQALGDLRRVLALDPNHYKALEGLGRMLREIDEKAAALKVYRALLKVYPLSESAQQAVRHLSHDIEGKSI